LSDPSLFIVVGARGGSKGLPGKNVKVLGGKNLLEWTCNAVKESNIPFDLFILSTDDKSIADIGRQAGIDVPFIRPAHLAEDKSVISDVVIHSLDWFVKEKGKEPDIILWLQPTSPFRSAVKLNEAYQILCNNDKIDAVIGSKRIYRSLSTLFLKKDGDILEALDPEAEWIGRQSSAPLVTPNGAFYFIRSSVFRQGETFFPQRLFGLEMDQIESVDIDDELDWCIADALVSSEEIRRRFK